MMVEKTEIAHSSSYLSDYLLPLGLVVTLTVMIVPLPSIILDMLLATSITFALIILLVAMYSLKPLDFSSFPSVLLVITLFRLSLNIASTRLILLNGDGGPAAAGQVIKSFGNFIVGGNYAVGLIVFIILVIINFIVITKGSGRIAEVAARFTLDAMPGKQMSVDADLNAGLITEDEARRRRLEIAEEADFYGSMDGASKFIKGDAIAGILITIINILGGFVIGVLQKGMTASDAASTYTLLTIGDGLVSQIPALLISTSAGIIMTRVASGSHMGRQMAGQIVTQPRALASAALILFFFGLMPGLPHLAFLTLSTITGAVAYKNFKKKDILVKRDELEKEDEPPPEKPPPEDMKEVTPVDLLGLEVGYRLVNLVDSSQGGELLDRIRAIRRQFAKEMGFIIPQVHIQDNLQIKPEEYVVYIKGIEVAKGQLLPNHYMAINPGTVQGELEGIPTKEPAFGLPAIWVEEKDKEKAQMMGYTVVNLATVVATHMSELIKTHMHEFLMRQETQALIDTLAKEHPKVVEELIPNLLTLGGVQKVLQNLLRERISIRDLLTILETLADYAVHTKDPDILAESVRQRLARQITKQYLTDTGEIPVMMMDQAIEETISKAVQNTQLGSYLSLEPNLAQKILNQIKEASTEVASLGHQPVVLTSPEIRRHLFRFMERFLPNVAVLSHGEISGDVKVQTLKLIRIENAHQTV